MPSSIIEVRKRYSQDQEVALISLDAKRLLYCSIVENLVPLGIPADHVTILVQDVPRENRGIRGGQAGCDVDIGFEIDV